MSRSTLFDRMRDDHRRVLEEIDALERDAAVRAELSRDQRLSGVVALLERQFETHMRAEDEALYPALEAALPDTCAHLSPLREDHLELRGMLSGLAATLARPAAPDRDEQIVVQVRDLVDLLRIHIRKEEAVVFSVAERVLGPDALDSISTRLFVNQDPPPARA